MLAKLSVLIGSLHSVELRHANIILVQELVSACRVIKPSGFRAFFPSLELLLAKFCLAFDGLRGDVVVEEVVSLGHPGIEEVPAHIKWTNDHAKLLN